MKGKRLLDWNIWTALHYIEISLLWSSCVGKREDLEILLFFMKAMRLVEKTLTLSWDKYSVPPPSWCASLGFSLLSNTYHTLIFHCVSIFFIVCFSLLEYQSFVYRAFVLFFFLIKEVEVVILLLFQVCTTMLFLRLFCNILSLSLSHPRSFSSSHQSQNEFQNSWHNMQAYYWVTASPPAWAPLQPGTKQSAKICKFSVPLMVYVILCV